MRTVPRGSDAEAWVELLGSASRRAAARQHLLGLGARAVPALRAGMHHDDPAVRLACAGLLSAGARRSRRGAGVARRGGDGGSAKGGAQPPFARTRAGAIDTLGKVVGRRPEVADALADVAEHDPVRGMREMARARLHR